MHTPSLLPRVALRHFCLASIFAPLSLTLGAAPAHAAVAKKTPVAKATTADALKSGFVTPPDNARPWVYWYFMDGNLSKEGMHADLEAMKKAGLGGGIYLEVGIGVPRGPVAFMSPEWQDDIKYAVFEAQRLGLQLALGTGPGWTGSGGPWVKPELSMQHLVASETTIAGPSHFDADLPRPKPRTPYFGEGSMTAQVRQDWLNYYQDEVVLAFPTPEKGGRIGNVDEKALYYRAPYSSGSVVPRLPAPASFPAVPAAESVAPAKMIDLTGKIDAQGHLNWDVPPGNWTIMRFGRTTTGQTTRPAPDPGLGLESDKFSKAAVAAHMDAYTGVLLNHIGPNFRKGDTGLVDLHFDSWEMSSQNWTEGYKQEFIKRRGYDPTPFLPAMMGYVVESPEKSERFLWDLRQTDSELVIENHAGYLRDYAHQRGLSFSVEPYDLNPSADLDLGATADLPMCEFWSWDHGFSAEYSCFESVSVAHTNGRKVIGAESFTADGGDAWLQHPGSMKNQLDWALCTGINKFVIHRYQAQPKPGQLPGMAMGPYGVHWEDTETWWDMVPAFHKYMARTSEMLRQGAPVADLLYLTPEGAPQVFTPPPSALTGQHQDHKGYDFDGVSPHTLMANAAVKDGRIVFPGGAAYRLLVMPEWDTMTPQLLGTIIKLVEAGATVVGAPPLQSPSLMGYPDCDAQVKTLATRLWGKAPYAAPRKLGKGTVVYQSAKHASKLGDAKWIWSTASAVSGVAPGTVYFSTKIEVDPKRPIASAIANFTADNTYDLTINGAEAVSGDNFHFTDETDVTRLLKPGTNELRVTAGNAGDSPNPAGLLGAISVTYKDGGQQTFGTGASWNASEKEGGPMAPAVELGGPTMGPWGVVNGTPSIYPDYVVTSKILSDKGVAPDFSSDAPMRFIHRRLSDGDLYFVANMGTSPIATTATFRVAGNQPEWWNPITGQSRPLTDFHVANGLTSIPVHLAGSESGFVVFRKPLAAKPSLAPNFPTWDTVSTLSKPWDVAFDAKWGAPAHITFDKLDDWSQRPEEGIKYYSGKATYTTTFDAPSGKVSKNATYALSLGVVKNMASVKLNGRDLGVVWCDPWQANITAGLLKPAGNQLEVTVANLWGNRLIGDAKLPAAQRMTQTTYRPFNADSPLLPSGLLGPVTLVKAGN